MTVDKNIQMIRRFKIVDGNFEPLELTLMTYSFVLKPNNWPDTDKCLCRPLIGQRTFPLVPWLAISSGASSQGFQLVDRAGLDQDATRQIIAAATQQLESQAVIWDISEKRGLIFKKPYILRAIVPAQTATTPDRMDDLSCEQLANSKAMMEASKILSTESIMAITPKRGWLLVCPGRPGEFPKMQEMHDAAQSMMGRAEPDQCISSNIFFLESGNLIGQAVRDDASGYISLAQPEESAWFSV
jgi:hypothetical protein